MTEGGDTRKFSVVAKLPFASTQLLRPPKYTLRQGVLRVDLHGADDQGRRKDSWIEFKSVLSFELVDFEKCTREHIDAYDQVIEIDTSRNSGRDFWLFLDDVGCLVVNAAEVQVGPMK